MNDMLSIKLPELGYQNDDILLTKIIVDKARIEPYNVDE